MLMMPRDESVLLEPHYWWKAGLLPFIGPRLLLEGESGFITVQNMTPDKLYDPVSFLIHIFLNFAS